MSLSEEDSHIPEDLNSLKKKLSSLMCAIDDISLKEDRTNTIGSDSTTETSYKYLESLHSAINERLIDIKLNVRESVLRSLETFENTIDQTLITSCQDDYNPKRLRKATDINANLIMEKNFRLRESTITELMNAREEFQTLKNMSLAIMSLFFINLMLQDYIDNGYFINITTLTWCFSKVDIVITTWVLMFMYSYLVIWLVKSIVIVSISYRIWIPLYIIYQLILVVFAGFITRFCELSFGSSMIVMCECFRLMMKIHSYFRTKLLYGWGNNIYIRFIPDFIKEKVNGANIELNLPEIKIEDGGSEVQKFTYFLFAPTLLYRDQYVSRAKSEWKFIGNNLMEFFLGIYYTFILYRIYLQPKFITIGKENSWNNVVLMSLVQTMLPSFLCMFILFYIVMHNWQNLWAELLRFPDRRFYEDWWNSMNLKEWIRKFITLNHEWLYTYVYIDLMRFSNEKITRKIAQFAAFTISALLHLSIITFSLGFMGFYQFIIFSTLAYLLVQRGGVKNHTFNILFWVEISVGISLMMTMYSRDYYRNNK